MLKKICQSLTGMLLALTLLGHAQAQTSCTELSRPVAPSPEQARAAMQQAHNRGFLWRIQKDGRTSFLYGTLHIARQEWMYPGPDLVRAFMASDLLALELDMLDADIQRRLSASVLAARGAVLPEPLTKRLQAAAAALCVPYENLAPLIPELQIETLTLMSGRPDGLEGLYAIDLVLAGMARGAKKDVLSLETPELQIQALQMGRAQDTEAYVKKSLDELQSGRARRLLDRLAGTWANMDYEQMAHFADWCECLDSDYERAFMKRMVDDRNPALAQQIDAQHRSGKRIFAAVGSLHMVGPKGLPALMQQLGYQVEAVGFKVP